MAVMEVEEVVRAVEKVKVPKASSSSEMQDRRENHQEEEILPFDVASQALALAQRNALDVTGTMLELNRLAQEQTGLLLQ